MNELTVRVDTQLRMARSAVPLSLLEQIKEELTLDNLEKETAKQEDQWGWQRMPDKIRFWMEDADGVFYLPRGYAMRLKKLLHGIGWDIDWDDHRVLSPVRTDAQRVEQFTGRELWPHQVDAVHRALVVQQGIIQAPTGSGKTVTILELFVELEQKMLVVTDRANIAEQWRDRARSFIGYEPGIIGDGEFDARDLTIGMVQTLYQRLDELGPEFFSQFGAVVIDECHHVPAMMFSSVLSRCPAMYRFGTTATPEDRDELSNALAQAVLGHIFHEVDEEHLYEEGILLRPRVIEVRTDFKHPFWRTHPAKNCEWYDDCDRTAAKMHRNNYHDVIAALIADEDRNRLIADWIAWAYRQGRAIIVTSERLAHLDELRKWSVAAGVEEDDAIKHTGELTTEERMEIAYRAEGGGIVLFSTIGNEALDIPRLDTLVLAFPTRSVLNTKQRLGRIKRFHREKQQPVVIDFHDQTSPLGGQFADRRRLVYKAGRLPIETSDDMPLLA